MEEFATYVKLASDILVPPDWPLGGIDKLVLTLARKIIDQCDSANLILQVRDVPTKLIIQSDLTGVMRVFQKVSKVETIGSYIYEIVLPKEEDSIRRRTFSGSCSSDESWPDFAICASTKANKISYYLMPPRLTEKTLISVEKRLRTLRRRAPQVIKRFQSDVRAIQTLACQSSFKPYRMHKYASSTTSITGRGTFFRPLDADALTRRQSWTREVSSQKENEIREQEKLLLKDTFGGFDPVCKVTVLQRSISDGSVSKDSEKRF